MNELVILESQSMRQKLCTDENISVLEKVGQLVILEETGWTTKENVALFYQVDINTIDQLVYRHKDELISDGYKVLSKKDFENLHYVSFKISNRGLAIFPRRCVLRIGMLLRDSVVAKLVRSYLLNAEEHLGMSPYNQQTLRHLVNQLDQHAVQLIDNADELKSHAEQLRSQTRLIKVIVDEIYRNRSHIDDVKTDVKANRERIIALEKLSEQQTQEPEVEYITQEQINILKQRVKEKGNPCRIWAKLRLHFDVTRYIFLPRDRFREVLDWLEAFSM